MTKKFLFSTMIASLLAFVGCQNEELVNENTNNGGEKVILTANIQGSAQTRLALTAGTDSNDKPIVKVAWREYDESNPETFSVVGENGQSMFTQVSDTEFSGTLPESYNSGASYYAFYNLELWSDMGRNYTFEQDGTLREQDMMMIAFFNEDDTSIEFQHQMSILKPTFKVGEDTVNNTITHIEMGVIKACSTTVVIDVKPTAPATTLQDDIYLTIPVMKTLFPDLTNFIPGITFNFAVTADGKDYTGSLTIPNIANWEPEGKLFTATIALTEVCNLPNGTTFKMAIRNVLPDDKSVQAIKFVAGSSANDTSAFDPNYQYKMPANAKYKIIDATATTPKTLEIHTTAEVFMFNTSCYGMFDGNCSVPNELAEITTIDFNNCINTSNVTNMAEMFQACGKLTSLDLSSFKFKNDVDVKDMFFWTGKATEGTAKIIVDEDGYNYLKDKSTSINSNYAKYVKPDGVTPWETSTP